MGEAHYPLADCPDIQAEYIRQLEEEKAETSNNNNNNNSEVAAIETGLSQVRGKGEGLRNQKKISSIFS